MTATRLLPAVLVDFSGERLGDVADLAGAKKKLSRKDRQIRRLLGKARALKKRIAHLTIRQPLGWKGAVKNAKTNLRVVMSDLKQLGWKPKKPSRARKPGEDEMDAALDDIPDAEPGEKDDYGVNCLIKNLQYASALGCRGVVVHVGKSVGREVGLALSNMRVNLLTAMEHATAACPILLETPAGQGTEMLTKYADFVDFVRTFESDRIAICVDTCHVFAAGCDPLTYIMDLLASATPGLLKLVHFNDSSGCCGSCVDRHAFIGTGEIGLEKLAAIAERCSSCHVPMLVE
jgi:hypothetical protein